jgi:hypothetical protein
MLAFRRPQPACRKITVYSIFSLDKDFIPAKLSFFGYKCADYTVYSVAAHLASCHAVLVPRSSPSMAKLCIFDDTRAQILKLRELRVPFRTIAHSGESDHPFQRMVTT